MVSRGDANIVKVYYRVLHPVARNIKLLIIIPSFPQQLTKYFIMCPLFSRHVSALLFDTTDPSYE
jgi:hypothetical protein